MCINNIEIEEKNNRDSQLLNKGEILCQILIKLHAPSCEWGLRFDNHNDILKSDLSIKMRIIHQAPLVICPVQDFGFSFLFNLSNNRVP